MIIERYKPGRERDVYARFEKAGRLLPDGVRYVNSWVNLEYNICFQLMESSSTGQIEKWVAKWNDLVDFEIFPVVNSDTAKMNID